MNEIRGSAPESSLRSNNAGPLTGDYEQATVDDENMAGTLKREKHDDERGNKDSNNQDKRVKGNAEGGKTAAPKKKRKRRKVTSACVYCRRSHMICDPGRPCQRCIKRNIGPLCRDDATSKKRGRKRKTEISSAMSTAAKLSSAQGSEISMGQSQMLGVYKSQQQSAQNVQNAQNVQSVQSVQNVQNMQSAQNTQSVRLQQKLPQQNAQKTKPVGYAKTPRLVSNAASAAINQRPFFYSEHAGSEFNSLTEFLSMIDDADVMNTISMDDDPMLRKLETASALGYSANNSSTNLNGQPSIDTSLSGMGPSASAVASFQFSPVASGTSMNGGARTGQSATPGRIQQAVQQPARGTSVRFQDGNPAIPYVSDVARAKFFLTAADPTTEISPEERLKQVINAKLEAGLLKPYNYAKGYQRLQTYMDNHMAASSRQRILKPLSLFRPGFRAIAKSLKDIDLILVEENFERMLLDYDRVFTSMAIPACLWRRTGEIYRGNKEFASLVEVSIDDLKNGKLTIYELMTEESSVNFWEKYGAIAFDKTQKAVLTSCNLRTKDGMRKQKCCFSFTIRRDKYNIPSCIVGNFIPIQ